MRLDYRIWWREYRLVVMAAYPQSCTWQEYLARYRLLHGLYAALGDPGGESNGDRRATEKDYGRAG